MSDRSLEFANSTLGRRLVGAVGLPRPIRLPRWASGRSRPVDGARRRYSWRSDIAGEP